MKVSDKRVLVTGASGFLGRHVVASLKKHGCRDVIVVRLDVVEIDDRGAVEQACDARGIGLGLRGGGEGEEKK